MNAAPFIVFLDLSKSNTGIAHGVAGSAPKTLSVKCSGLDDQAALMRLGRWLIEFSKVRAIDWLYVEAAINPGAFLGEWDPDQGRVRATSNPQTTIALAKMLAVVEFVCGMKNIPFRTAHVQTVRKAFLGNGRPADPKKRVRAMCAELGWDPKNDDEGDALAGWYYATTQVAPRFYAPITPMLQSKIRARFDAPNAEEALYRGRRG